MSLEVAGRYASGSSWLFAGLTGRPEGGEHAPRAGSGGGVASRGLLHAPGKTRRAESRTGVAYPAGGRPRDRSGGPRNQRSGVNPQVAGSPRSSAALLKRRLVAGWQTDPVDGDVTQAMPVEAADAHRSRAAHLYGLIVSGAVLATAPDDVRLFRVAIILFCTLGIYWAAETYVHWIAARTLVQRDLTPQERRKIIADGWPLVAACTVPLLFLAGEALLGVDTSVALNLTLAVNAVLLLIVGWQMGTAGGLAGVRLVLSAGATGLLGLALIATQDVDALKSDLPAGSGRRA